MNGTRSKLLRKLDIGKKNIAIKIVIYLALLFVAYVTLMPFIVMLEDLWATPVTQSVDPRVPVEVTYSWKNFFNNINVFKKSDNYLWITFKNSFIIASCATLLNVYFSAMTAYAITAYEWKLRQAHAVPSCDSYSDDRLLHEAVSGSIALKRHNSFGKNGRFK